MADRYQRFAGSSLGQVVSRRLGLPRPAPLRRHKPGRQSLEGPVLLGEAPGGSLTAPAARVLAAIGAETSVPTRGEPQDFASEGGLATSVWNPAAGDGDTRFAALLFDASGIRSSEELRTLYEFFHPTVRRVSASGRILVLGTPPEDAEETRQSVAQRALEGFTRSIGKEVGNGATV